MNTRALFLALARMCGLGWCDSELNRLPRLHFKISHEGSKIMTTLLLRKQWITIFAVSICITVSLNPLCDAQTSLLPQLRQQGTATQFIVDGKPFLVLGGELGSTGR